MSSIADWQKTLANRCFWASYLSMRIHLENDEDMCDFLERIFETDFSKIDALNDVLRGFNQTGTDNEIIIGSILSIPFGSGYTWQIQFNTIPGIYHYLLHPTFSEPLLTGYDDSHFHLPIFRWSEVIGLVTKLEKNWVGPFPAHFLIPLFAPLVYLKPAEQATAQEVLLTAWVKTGLLAEEKTRELVQRLTWTTNIHWIYDENLGWVTDSPHSHRNPLGIWRITPEAFQQFRQFLNICTE